MKNDWALVTGASAGLGREFCEQLARSGMNIVLVARRKHLLADIAARLEAAYGIETLVVTADLSRIDQMAEAQKIVAAHGIRIRLLVNNAAINTAGRFETNTASTYTAMIQLNAIAPTYLSRVFLDDLCSHKTSAIVNLSSQAAYQPMPYASVYAATKSYIHNFSQALYEEFRGRGLLVQAFVPPPTSTESTGTNSSYKNMVTELQKPETVVKMALRHLKRSTPVASGAKGVFFQRLFAGLFPSKTVVEMVGKRMKPPE